MSGYVIAGYAVTFGALATYAASLLWRSAKLAKRAQ